MYPTVLSDVLHNEGRIVQLRCEQIRKETVKNNPTAISCIVLILVSSTRSGTICFMGSEHGRREQ
jgi:hypothetical protein